MIPATGTPPTPPPSDANSASDKLAGAIRTVSGVTLISRFGGLAREVLVVRIFADSPALGSAFIAAFAIPNLFRRLFGEGALAAAFLPEYAQAHKASLQEADRFASLTTLALLLFTTALTILGELALLLALWLLPYDADRILSLKLIMVMLPFMPLVCTAAILGGMLQVHGRFGPAATGPIILNAMIVATGLYFLITGSSGNVTIAYTLGIATVLSGLTQCFWFFKLLRPYVQWTRAFGQARTRARRMLSRFFPVLLGMGTLQINTFLDTLYAMWPIWVGPMILGITYPMDESSNLILASAQRLYQFPLGVFGIAVATAIFPLLARNADEPAHFLDTLRRGIRLSLFIGIPASIGLILIRHDVTALLYGFGTSGFDRPALGRSAAALLGFAPAIWAYSLNHVLTRAFYAQGDTRTPMRIAIAMVAVNFLINLALIWHLREAGLAWATSISATIQCAVLAVYLRRTPAASGRFVDSEGLKSAGLIILASAIMAAAILSLHRLLPLPATWTGHAAGVVITAATGIITFTAAAALFRLNELRWLVKRGPRSTA